MPRLDDGEIEELLEEYKHKRKIGRRTKNNKTYLQIQRRRLVAAFYLKGLPCDEIAEQLGCGEEAVYKDISFLRDKWLEDSVEDFDQKKATELAKIDNLERECWERYQLSCNDTVTTHTKTERERRVVERDEEGNEIVPGTSPERKEERDNPGYEDEEFDLSEMEVPTNPVKSIEMVPTRTIEETSRRSNASGDTKLLERISWCIEQRLKIIGVYKKEVSGGNTVVINFDQLTGRDTVRINPVESRIAEIKKKRLEELEYNNCAVDNSNNEDDSNNNIIEGTTKVRQEYPDA